MEVCSKNFRLQRDRIRFSKRFDCDFLCAVSPKQDLAKKNARAANLKVDVTPHMMLISLHKIFGITAVSFLHRLESEHWG